MINLLIKLAEKGLLSDSLIRFGIKRLCSHRLAEATSPSEDQMEKEHAAWVEAITNSPIALVPEKANEQHYEVPPKLFDTNFVFILFGKRRHRTQLLQKQTMGAIG